VLIPICQGVNQIYLVGDPSQLPATVLSSRAAIHGYDMSLFSRIMKAGYPVILLTLQYRMHPIICKFPSDVFYYGSLLDSSKVHRETKRVWHDKLYFSPLVFYDVRGREKLASGSASFLNELEAHCAVTTYMHLITNFSQLRVSNQCGIISPYKDQVELIHRMISAYLGGCDMLNKCIDVDTIDGIQGREKDVVIFSSVRTRLKRNIGFMADDRRLNVGLTRARSSMIVIGHTFSLSNVITWKSLVDYCKEIGALFMIHKTKTQT